LPTIWCARGRTPALPPEGAPVTEALVKERSRTGSAGSLQADALGGGQHTVENDYGRWWPPDAEVSAAGDVLAHGVGLTGDGHRAQGVDGAVNPG
jgi:hypothetical protein